MYLTDFAKKDFLDSFYAWSMRTIHVEDLSTCK